MVKPVYLGRAAIIHMGIFSIQVCVPKDWEHVQVEAFANKEMEADVTGSQWVVKTDYTDAKEANLPEHECHVEVPCIDDPNMKHLMLLI
jgi:hypothetical protein